MDILPHDDGIADLDAWAQFLRAIAAVAGRTRPNLTVAEALIEAIEDWTAAAVATENSGLPFG